MWSYPTPTPCHIRRNWACVGWRALELPEPIPSIGISPSGEESRVPGRWVSDHLPLAGQCSVLIGCGFLQPSKVQAHDPSRAEFSAWMTLVSLVPGRSLSGTLAADPPEHFGEVSSRRWLLTDTGHPHSHTGPLSARCGLWTCSPFPVPWSVHQGGLCHAVSRRERGMRNGHNW